MGFGGRSYALLFSNRLHLPFPRVTGPADTRHPWLGSAWREHRVRASLSPHAPCKKTVNAPVRPPKPTLPSCRSPFLHPVSGRLPDSFAYSLCASVRRYSDAAYAFYVCDYGQQTTASENIYPIMPEFTLLQSVHATYLALSRYWLRQIISKHNNCGK